VILSLRYHTIRLYIDYPPSLTRQIEVLSGDTSMKYCCQIEDRDKYQGYNELSLLFECAGFFCSPKEGVKCPK